LGVSIKGHQADTNGFKKKKKKKKGGKPPGREANVSKPQPCPPTGTWALGWHDGTDFSRKARGSPTSSLTICQGVFFSSRVLVERVFWIRFREAFCSKPIESHPLRMHPIKSSPPTQVGLDCLMDCPGASEPLESSKPHRGFTGFLIGSEKSAFSKRNPDEKNTPLLFLLLGSC
jgi:hypothetical protein